MGGDKCSEAKVKTSQNLDGHSLNWHEVYLKPSEKEYRQCEAEKASAEPIRRPQAASSDQPAPKTSSLPNLELTEDKKG